MNKTKFVIILMSVLTAIMALMCVDAYFAETHPNNMLILFWRTLELICMFAYVVTSLVGVTAFLTGVFESLKDKKK